MSAGAGMSGSGSGGGPLSRVLGQVQSQAASTAPAGAAYSPVQQGPVYRPQYDSYQPQARAPQMQQMPNYQSGLQAAMMQIMQQYNRPMMREPTQQGIAPSNPMAYRPTVPTDNLRRVAPGVGIK